MERRKLLLKSNVVLSKFQPGLWGVLEPKLPLRGGQHLAGTSLLSIPVTLSH
jgi:hypothetical protein